MCKKLFLILSLSFLWTFSIFCQIKEQQLDSVNIFAEKSKLKIFDPSKTFVYDAYFIEANGDTLTKEKLILKGNDKPWKYQKSQTELEIIYTPDTLKLKTFIHPWVGQRKRISKSKTKKSWANFTYIKDSEITGFFENDSIIWLHPPRCNQYVYTYLTAYPEVQLNELKIGGNWKGKLFILRGIPNNEEHVGTVINDFNVKNIISDTISGKLIENCWLIESIDTHSKLGKSKSTFVFEENYYGFIRMDFEYYNGIKIHFKLLEIVEN